MLECAQCTCSGSRPVAAPGPIPCTRPGIERSNVEVRQRVATAAGALDDGRVPGLLTRLIADRAPEVRTSAALAFARSGQLSASAPYLIDVVTADLDMKVLDAAFAATFVHGHPLRTNRNKAVSRLNNRRNDPSSAMIRCAGDDGTKRKGAEALALEHCRMGFFRIPVRDKARGRALTP